MPIYEYQCSACNHTFDKLQKMSDAPLTQCPECGKNTVDKLVSAAGFQLKGTGWYVTDFKDKPKAPEKKSEQKSEKKPDTKKTEKKAKTTGSKD
ncbi:MAG: zinc ribbon domain-containing protein [Legionella sp.]|nr:zinc ribbon domain-containing protein [Legionella sp.]